MVDTAELVKRSRTQLLGDFDGGDPASLKLKNMINSLTLREEPGAPTVISTNAACVLTPGTTNQEVIHTGVLTADRACTFASGAWAGEVFRITRSGTGAFNLNVGTGPLKAMATATWATFIYDGSAWYLAAAGSL